MIIPEDMDMESKGTAAVEHGEQHARREHEAASKSQLVMVDLARRQSPRQVKRLRKGRGPLMKHIDEIVEELVQSGTVQAGAQPVVILMREKVSMPWPFADYEYDDDDDDDDED
jgi:Family of unknown function (DUF6200)